MSINQDVGVTSVREVRVPAGRARAVEVKAGEYVSIVDVEGQQVGDLVAFNANDYTEWLSPAHTRTSLMSLALHVGDQLRSNRRTPMFEVVQDTVGVHDTLLAACDSQRYLLDYGVSEHRNCLDNFAEILDDYGISRDRIPGTLNLFENVRVEADGSFEIVQPCSKAGDRLVLRALMDALVAVSACPMDLNPTNAGAVTDLMIVVSSNPPKEG